MVLSLNWRNVNCNILPEKKKVIVGDEKVAWPSNILNESNFPFGLKDQEFECSSEYHEGRKKK